jgi:hypothetical protein
VCLWQPEPSISGQWKIPLQPSSPRAGYFGLFSIAVNLAIGNT